MSLRSQFDEIVDSVRNGQRKQASRQASELDRYELCQLLDYAAKELQDTELAHDIAKTIIRYWEN